jgi:hypothetical protein
MSGDFFWRNQLTRRDCRHSKDPRFLEVGINCRLPGTGTGSALDAVDAAIIQHPQVGATTSSPCPSPVSIPLDDAVGSRTAVWSSDGSAGFQESRIAAADASPRPLVVGR